MENASGAAFFLFLAFCSHVSFGVIPDSVDNRITVFE